MYKIDETLGFRTRIPRHFDLEEFELMYEDSKKSLERNVDWKLLDMSTIDSLNPKKDSMKKYFESFFGLKARMQGKIVFSVYHESDPERTLFYCACYQERDIKALHFDLTLFRKDITGTKSWIKDFYTVTGPLFKPMVESMGLKAWYYVLNGNSDFVEKDMLGTYSVIKDKIFAKKYPSTSRIITSIYGWD